MELLMLGDFGRGIWWDQPSLQFWTARAVQVRDRHRLDTVPDTEPVPCQGADLEEAVSAAVLQGGLHRAVALARRYPGVTLSPDAVDHVQALLERDAAARQYAESAPSEADLDILRVDDTPVDYPEDAPHQGVICPVCGYWDEDMTYLGQRCPDRMCGVARMVRHDGSDLE